MPPKDQVRRLRFRAGRRRRMRMIEAVPTGGY
jgi:hypothetical protein